MIRLLSILVVLTSVCLTVWVVLDNDGQIMIEWLDYYVETSFIFAVVLLLFCLVMFTILFNFICFISKLPTELSERYYNNKKRKNLLTLVDGFIAFEIGDKKRVDHICKKIINNSTNTKDQITSPLEAIFLAKSGNHSQVENLCSEMISSKKHLSLANGMLFTIRYMQEKFLEAADYGEKLVISSALTYENALILIDIYTKLSMWENALKILYYIHDKFGYSVINMDKYYILFINHANFLQEKDDINAAITLIENSLKTYKSQDLIIYLSKAYLQIDKKKQAIKILEQACKSYSSIKLAEELLLVCTQEQVTATMSEFKQYLDLSKPEGYFALANYLIQNSNHELARTLLSPLLETYASNPQLAKLMALIETKSSGKYQAISSWIEKI